ncbi:MAG TPA: GNAT family N-acetyltransferase [Thermoplasmata archaeon]|jgi:ribosomal protein S18 acetylase RimI-like enzyme|nr:GNAT family N-acetyltransferase [Thermoplasmata archaeon]
MLRQIERADIPVFFDLMSREFPDENAIYGWHPAEFQRVVRKFWRPWYRLLLGLADAVGRPFFRFYVLDVDGAYAASAIETFGGRLAYVSSVVVAPEFRRKGYAKRVLAACHDAAARRKARFVALDVLDPNTTAQALYDSLGYRPVSHASHFVRRSMDGVAAPPTAPFLRAYERTDAERLAELARQYTPATRQEVQPVGAAQFHVPGAVVNAFDSKTMAWVVDRGSGPIAWTRASASPVMDAGHLTAPVIAPEATDPEVAALLATALAWSKAEGSTRAVAEVLDENVRAAAGLRAAGFEVAYGSRTLARPTGVA